jgi:hypothetical protein
MFFISVFKPPKEEADSGDGHWVEMKPPTPRRPLKLY